ncbi:MAG: hypothetical protein C0445_10320 [Polaromonas sp.]|nr:hypothetical protein [Polaromonas sp.]
MLKWNGILGGNQPGRWAMALCACLLMGCGQKGPLYLPAPPQGAPAAAAPNGPDAAPERR